LEYFLRKKDVEMNEIGKELNGKMMKHIIFLSVFLISVLPLWVFSQEVTFRTNTKTSVETGEQFRVVFEVNAEGGGFSGPDFKGFNILTGPMMSTSSSIQIINGRMDKTFSQTYTYILTAKTEGEFIIEPATVTVDGKRYQSNKVTVKVGPAAVKSNSGNATSNEGNNQSEGISAKDIFLKAIPDKKNMVVGEQAIITYRLYTRLPLSNLSVTKLSSFPGFWTKNLLDTNGDIQQSTQVIDGVEYIVADIRKVALFPQKGGKLTIEPMELSCLAQVRTQSKRAARDPFESFFNDPFFNRNVQNVEKNLVSEQITLQVDPLPVSRRPQAFKGAVGQFGFQSSIDRNTIKAGDAVNLTFSISGTGNLELIELPSPAFPADFEVYEPKISTDIKTSSSGVSGSRKVEYLIIPRFEGTYQIPPLEFVYFDPKKNEFMTLSSQQFEINVEKSDGSGTREAMVTTAQEGIRYLGSDIRHINLNTNSLNKRNSFFFASPLYFIIVFGGLILFGFALWFDKKQNKLRKNQSLVKFKQATKVAKKKLSNAQQFLKSKDQNAFYLEMSQALWGYLSDKFSIPRSELSFDNVQTALEQQQAPTDLVEAFISTLNNCEYARFAPGDASKKMEDLYQQGIEVITKAERLIK